MATWLLYPDDGAPSESGWYPTLHCWEVEEGAFADAHYWTGEQWRDAPLNASLSFLRDRRGTKAEAEALADEADPHI